MKLRHSARTDVGKTRDHNEDSYGLGGGDRAAELGELLVVCDGMGGHAAGEVASQIGVTTIVESYYGDSSENRPNALEQAFEHANGTIFAQGQGSMGTTGVAALLLHDALHMANVGDSRGYLIRDGEIRQVTRDHSFVSDQVAAGLITADQARFSPHRNVITRALGYQAEVSVDLFRLPLQIGDTIVLSSDGMHGLVSDAEILEIAGAQPPEQATEALIALANGRGGTDNITVIVARVEALDWLGAELENPDLSPRVTVELPTTGAIEALEPEASADATTEELPPVDAPEPAAAPAVAPPAPAPATPPAPARPAAAQPAPARKPAPAEPRLNWRGLLLALLLLAALIAILLFYPIDALLPSTAPDATPTLAAATAPANTPAATAAATPEITPSRVP